MEGLTLLMLLILTTSALLFSASPAADRSIFSGHHPESSVTATASKPPLYSAAVRFVNRTFHRRREWAIATVPFPMGAWDGASPYQVTGVPSEIVPFGARWPDGTVRYAQVLAHLDLMPSAEVDLTVAPGTSSHSFQVSPWLAHGLSQFSLRVVVGVPGIGPQTANLQVVKVESDTAARKAIWMQGRVPECNLVVDLWISAFSNQDHMPFELKVTDSRIGSREWYEDFDYIDLRTSGVLPMVRGAPRRGCTYQALSPSGVSSVRLMPRARLFDGQGHEWIGDLVAAHTDIPVDDAKTRISTLLALQEMMFYGCARNWRESGGFGPFGVIPERPRWIRDEGVAATTRSRSNYLLWINGPGRTWDDLPLAMFPNANLTGEHTDFGVSKLLDIVDYGIPDMIEEARFCCSEEANRPVHHREADGSRILASDHPNWVAWSGRSHSNSIICPDRLGKPYPEPYMEFNGWTSKDHQHWSSLTLAATYLLTASYAVREELVNEAEMYVAAHTLPSERPGWTTNSIDTPRAIGRTFLSMSWNFICTGREDVRWRMAQRAAQCVVPFYAGLQPGVVGPVRPIVLIDRDPRVIDGMHWRPWEESLAVVGLEAAYRLTGEPAARRAAQIAARNLVENGWKVSEAETIVATGVLWQPDGSRLTEEEYDQPEKVAWSYGTGYNVWSLPAVILAEKYARIENDSAYEARSKFIKDRVMKDRVQHRYEVGWDRFGDWMAVN